MSFTEYRFRGIDKETDLIAWHFEKSGSRRRRGRPRPDTPPSFLLRAGHHRAVGLRQLSVFNLPLPRSAID